ASLMSINQFLVTEQRTKQAQSTKSKQSQQESLSDTKTPADSLSELEKTLQTAADSALQGLDSLENLNVSPIFSLAVPQGSFRYSLTDTAEINRIFRRPEVRNRLPRNAGIFWAHKPDKTPNNINEEPRLQLYFLDLGRNRKAKLTGEVIVNARKELDQQAQPVVSMSMNATGTRVWAKWTGEAAAKGSRIAIVLDNVVFSAPYVRTEIPNGNSVIEGNFTNEEATDLANILKAGSLPAPIVIVEETVVGPTLGAESIRNGLI